MVAHVFLKMFKYPVTTPIFKEMCIQYTIVRYNYRVK